MIRKPESPRLAASSSPVWLSRRSTQAVAEPGSLVARWAASRASTAVRASLLLSASVMLLAAACWCRSCWACHSPDDMTSGRRLQGEAR